ncbi:hypothetical protein [Gloeothece verrucosa]|nr:hypothetical protein [Gloeothece verrucosa]
MKSLISVTLLATISLTLALKNVAQNPPAKTYQPGFWQPVARVEVKRPLAIQLVNETDIPLEYDFTTSYDVPPQPIQPKQTVTLEEQFRLPAYLLINPSSQSSTASGGTPFNLKFNVDVNKDNVVTVKIVKVDSNTPGNTTFNIHETGAIYVY